MQFPSLRHLTQKDETSHGLTVDLQEAIGRADDLIGVGHCQAVCRIHVRFHLERDVRVAAVLEVDRQAQLLVSLQDLCTDKTRFVSAPSSIINRLVAGELGWLTRFDFEVVCNVLLKRRLRHAEVETD